MPDALPVSRAGELEQQAQEQQWLIEGLWARSAIGLIGGAPKCCKTWFGLDMAVSVASATAAMGHFAVTQPGPTLVYLAEDALPQVRSRIESLCRQRGIEIERLDLHVITSPILRLDLATDQERLGQTIAALRPRLVLLDPLVRMHRLDENSAAEISGLLGYIRNLQRQFDTAIVLVHHASKKQRSQPGQALRGSSDLHAIGDCNAYLARNGQHIVLTIEHRAARSPEPMRLELAAEGDTTSLRVVADGTADSASASCLDERIVELISSVDGPMTRTALRDRLRVNNQRLGDALRRLEDEHKIVRNEQGWTST
ncbi:MAG: AAA family ATPase [bacterium]|nr:AAA family ATPase [bacterium]